MEKKQKIKELIAGACLGVYIGLWVLLALFDQKIWLAIFTLVPNFILFFPSFLRIRLIPSAISKRKLGKRQKEKRRIEKC